MRPIALLTVLVAAAAALAAPPSVESLRRDVQRALKLQTPGEQASAIAKAFDGHDSADRNSIRCVVPIDDGKRKTVRAVYENEIQARRDALSGW